MKNAPHKILPFPRTRQLMVDGGKAGLKKHTIHGLVEFDITDTRKALRQHRIETGEAISFAAYFLVCLGKTIAQDPQVHAYRDWRNRMVLFDDVDVNMLFEVEEDGQKIIRPHILRGVNRKSAGEIEQEIRDFQKNYASSTEARQIDLFVLLPAWIRRLMLWWLLKNPDWVKAYYGTVMVSSIGMFGSGGGWGLPVPNHTLQITLGGIGEKPGVVNQQVEVRKIMSVTISLDHDIVDGAPAARFIKQLKGRIEKASEL